MEWGIFLKEGMIIYLHVRAAPHHETKQNYNYQILGKLYANLHRQQFSDSSFVYLEAHGYIDLGLTDLLETFAMLDQREIVVLLIISYNIFGMSYEILFPSSIDVKVGLTFTPC